MHVRKVTLIFIYLASVVVSFVMADMESTKRTKPGTSSSSHTFHQMMRYGRSNGKINVYPRSDVFYLGPRYGKRSMENTALPCVYTGVTNLYRCNTSRSTLKQLRV